MDNQVFVIAGLMILALLFLMTMFAKLFRKAGPHEAIIVYGFRGTRVVKGRGTVIFPMVESCRGLSLELMSLRRGAEAGPLHPAGRGGHRGGRGADQGEERPGIDPDRRRAVPHQDARRARRPHPPGDGRPPARHHRPVDGGRDRQAAGDGGRAHARHLRRRHEQDGPRSDLLHHQGSPRQERVHHQHGPARRGAHQARRRRGRRRSRARHRHQARRSVPRIGHRQGPGRPGARAGGDAVAGQAGRGAARSRSQEGRIPGNRQEAAGAGGQGLRDPDQHHAAAGARRGSHDSPGGEGARSRGAGRRNPAPRARADRHRPAGGRVRTRSASRRWPRPRRTA